MNKLGASDLFSMLTLNASVCKLKEWDLTKPGQAFYFMFSVYLCDCIATTVLYKANILTFVKQKLLMQQVFFTNHFRAIKQQSNGKSDKGCKYRTVLLTRSKTIKGKTTRK